MAPLTYLRSAGAPADAVHGLIVGVTVISVVVVVVIGVFVVGGSLRNRTARAAAVTPGAAGLDWLVAGVGLSAVVLVGTVIWTMIVLADVSRAPKNPALTIEVTGNQWWWRARYLNSDPARILTTANEIHIPVGKPVLLTLQASDVIHSFWVPLLAGKTDLIPGMTNVTWIEADRPGRYFGTCGEFCGLQHAHMGLVVVADTASDFQAWWDNQLTPAPADLPAAAARGRTRFEQRCGACHTVRGTGAGGAVAPDLTHLMSRGTIAGGMLANNAGNLSAWVADPQSLKPGTRMPRLNLSGPELNDIRAFLLALK